jgi:hypothetical protein
MLLGVDEEFEKIMGNKKKDTYPTVPLYKRKS